MWNFGPQSMTFSGNLCVFNLCSKNYRLNPAFVSTRESDLALRSKGCRSAAYSRSKLHWIHGAHRVSWIPLDMQDVSQEGTIRCLENELGRFDQNLFKVETLAKDLKWDEKGLVVATAQNIDTGTILMQGFANKEAIVNTACERKATFYSRSRSQLWIKGETSNNFIDIYDINLDCDNDSIIYLGKPGGPACHTGTSTCFYTSLYDLIHDPQVRKKKLALSTLYSLENLIYQRKAELSDDQIGNPSWTKRLLLNNKLLCSKIREEADELCRTMEDGEGKSRTASEMADMLYHALVLLAVQEVRIEEVFQLLRERFSQSGIEEKNNRAPKVDQSADITKE